MRRWILGVLLVGLSALPLQAAGTATWAPPTNPSPGLRAYRVATMADGTGAVTGTATAIKAGRILQVRIAPGTSGNQPDDQFDVAVVDQNGVDILGGAGADLSNAAGTIIAGLDAWADTSNPTLDVQITNAGASKRVTVVILVQLAPGEK